MPEPMKKLPTKKLNKLQVNVNNVHYDFKGIPKAKLKILFSFLGELEPYKNEEKSIPWCESPTIKNLLNKAGDNTDYQTGAVALKGLREDKGYSQKKLAEMIKRDQGVISKMEHGKIPIGKTIAKRFEEIFDVSYKVFL